MASRRTRIKGIANIPQRRKNNVTNEEPIEPQIKIENCDNLTFDSITKNETEIQPKARPNIVIKHETNWSEFNPNSKDCSRDISQNISILDSSNIITNSNINNENAIKVENNQVSDNEAEKNIVPKTIQQPKPLLMRRKFIKPVISANAINRKSKQETGKECLVKSDLSEEENNKRITEEKQTEGKIIILDKVVIPPRNTADSTSYKDIKNADIKPKQPQPSVTNLKCVGLGVDEATLNETHLTPQNGIIKPEVFLDRSVRKVTPYTNCAHSSDTEYPPPPQSPSKINRSRIKAIPRLSHRKTSFSASESEDESRKHYNRNRNDSVCSTASGVVESFAECLSPQRPKEVNTVVQKKCNRTEQSRKLAEARREFQRRFGANKPDRQKLTMIDLIFYNPTSNPMTSDAKLKQEKVEEVDEIVLDDEISKESEKVDPTNEINEDVGKSDEENEMPVPQIKIGPSGEIILDEKSLVIESKEVKKQREQLQKTQIVDGDFDTGYGVYKRQKRAKDWTHTETLRFYKALNTIGTDFYLMCELFPRRTRRELKIKFKKEERINRTLIDRAVMQPCRFDFTELKHEVEMEEKELEELQKQKEEEDKLKLEKHEMKLSRKRKALTKLSMEESKKPVKISKPKPPKIRKPRKPRAKRLCIENILQDSDADESDIATQSESDDEISMPLKQTRSGRIPKISEKYDSSRPMSVENIIKRNRVENTKANNIEPGSIMIITEKGPNGEPVYKIFMVTPDQNATPLNLTSEVVSKAIEFKKGITAQNILTISANVTDDEGENNIVHEENNVTIPADENVTTLKGNNELWRETLMGDGAYGTVIEYNYTIPADENVTIPADENVTILSDENVTIPADENVTILADENVTILADENVTIPANENVTLPGYKNITIPPDEKFTIPADENVMAPADENIAILANQNVTLPDYKNIMILPDETFTIPANENVTIPADENVILANGKIRVPSGINRTSIKQDYLSEGDANISENMDTS